MQADREVEQIKQMFNMDKDQTLLQMPLIDVDQARQMSYAKKRAHINRVKSIH